MDKANAKTYYQAGVRFLKEDRFLEAINAFTKAIQFDPNLWDAFLMRGMAQGKKGEDEKAIEDFNIYINHVKDEPSAFLFRGNGFFNLKDFESAIRDYDQAVKLDPEWHKAYVARGDTYYKIKNHSAAIEDYSKAIELDPTNINTYLLRSYVYYFSGQQDLALQDLNETVRLDPDSTFLLSNRADLKKNIGDIPGAIEDLDKAIQIDVNNYDAVLQRGILYSEIIRDFQKAIADFDAAIRINPEIPSGYNYRGTAYLNLGEYIKALEDINEGIRLDPNNYEIFMTRGHIYRKIGDFQSALNDFEKYKNSYPNDSEAFLIIGHVYFHDLKETNKAKEYYMESLRLNPNNFHANNNLGLINQSEHNFDLAISFFSDAIRINPEYPFTYISRADIYISQGNFQLALEDLNMAVKNERSRILALKLKANVLKKIGEYEHAMDNLKTAIMLAPDDPGIYVERGDIWYEKKEYGKAVEDYFQAILVESKKGDFIKMDAPDPSIIAKSEETLGSFAEAISKDPPDFSKINDLAEICWKAKNYRYPQRLLEVAVQIFPEDVIALQDLGYIHSIRGNLDIAIDLITRCIILFPEKSDFFDNRAKYFEKKGDIASAIKDYEEAARLDPEKYQDIYLEFFENQKDMKSD